MSAKFFLDTNILVYSFDLTAPEKCRRARELINTALKGGNGVISFQVAQEFINFALKTKFRPMTLEQAQKYYQKILKPLCVIHSSAMLYNRAFDIKRQTKFSWYDSVVIASAEEAACDTLYSEDMQHNRLVGPVRIRNPFLN